MSLQRKILAAGSLVVLVSVFMPWLMVSTTTIRGYQLMKMLASGSSVWLSIVAGSSLGAAFTSSSLLIGTVHSDNATNYGFSGGLLCLLPNIALIAFWDLILPDGSRLAIGFWVNALGAVAMMASWLDMSAASTRGGGGASTGADR